MTREEAKDQIVIFMCDEQKVINDRDKQALDIAIKVLEQEPCEDCISRQAVLDAIENEYKGKANELLAHEIVNIMAIIDDVPPVNLQEPNDFAKWVATEIFDEMWEYNKDAFAEIACRKLAKLGIVRAKGDEWELVEPQESEE